MQQRYTTKRVTESVKRISNSFENCNNELKKQYLKYNIEAFLIITKRVPEIVGVFGTGYPFYALDENLEGRLPIIEEQLRYNRELVAETKSEEEEWACKECIENCYSEMEDLKQNCKPCKKTKNGLKPRKIINRMPDIDLWVVIEDGNVEIVEEKLKRLFEKSGMEPSDIDPLKTIEDMKEIVKSLKKGENPRKFLPLDTHIVEKSEIEKLVKDVPKEVKTACKNGRAPFLSIHPRSYRKKWQYDDEGYNFVHDFLASFHLLKGEPQFKKKINITRQQLIEEYSEDELLEILKISSSDTFNRRFSTPKITELFLSKVKSWRNLQNGKKKYEKPIIEYRGGEI